MPLFIFLSGLFCKNTIDDGRKTAVSFLVNIIFDQEAYFQLFTEGGAPWYLFAMAAFYAIFYNRMEH